MKIKQLTSAKETRISFHGSKFSYDTNSYPFKDKLEELFGTELSELHNWLGEYKKFERKNDQQTILHRIFYSNYKKTIQPLYENFIRNFLSKKIDFPFAYQKIPTFRLGLPNNKFVGEFHKDSKYNHPDFEFNFNLGLTNFLEPCCLMSEKRPNTNEFFPYECNYGEILSINHIDCVHGCNLNSTNETLVSIDFRLAMIPFYKELDLKSINTKSAFLIGDYFSNEIINK